MNRTAALLLALATLLAHALLIHQDGSGGFGPPYDVAHVPFRMARNLIQEGTLDWNPGTAEPGRYPSPLWIAVCAVAERLYLQVTTFAQTFGVLCTLATVVLAAQFTRDRLAGVIAPVLLVVNGGVAAAGTGGTEVALLTLLVTAGFLALERRASRPLALVLVLLVLTRPEGALAAVLLGGLELLRRVRTGRPSLLRPFLPALFLVAALAARRWSRTGSPFVPELLAGDPDLGLRYLASFFPGAGAPLLLAVPLVLLLRGRLAGRSRRALLFSLGWLAWVGWTGGDDLPFWNAVVPTLPLLFLAVQDGMTTALDTRRPAVALAAAGLLLAGAAGSVLASKLPGRIGVLPPLPSSDSWTPDDAVLAGAYGEHPGRRGLLRRLARAERLRSVGIFLRDEIDGPVVVLSPWPGAIGYLSGHIVRDLLERVTPSPVDGAYNPWHGTPRGDVVAGLERLPDYVVAWIDPLRAIPDRPELIEEWLTRYDRVGPTPERREALDRALDPYEVVSVAVPASSAEPEVPSEVPVALLRRSDLRRTPLLRVRRRGEEFHVEVRHRGAAQLVDLEVTAEGRDGTVRYLHPTGIFRDGPPVRARTGLRLHPSGSRRIELVRSSVPEDLPGARVRAVLRNPDASGPWTSRASEEAGPPRQPR